MIPTSPSTNYAVFHADQLLNVTISPDDIAAKASFIQAVAATLPSVDAGNIVITNMTSQEYVVDRRSLSSTVVFTVISYTVKYVYIGLDDSSVYLQLITQVATAVASGDFTTVLHTMAYTNNATSMIFAACNIVPTFSAPTVVPKVLPHTDAPSTNTHTLQVSWSLEVTLGLGLGLGLPLLFVLVALFAAYRRRIGFKATPRPLPPHLVDIFHHNDVFEVSETIVMPDVSSKKRLD